MTQKLQARIELLDHYYRVLSELDRQYQEYDGDLDWYGWLTETIPKVPYFDEKIDEFLANYISKDEILKARPALRPVDWNDISTPELIAKQSEAYGRNEALKDWSKALGIGETE